jgi:polar amino acid transport system substrate-binding protein
MKSFYLFILLFIPTQFAHASSDTLRAGYYLTPPFIQEDEQGNLEGVSYWLWQEVSNNMQLPYRTVNLPLDSLLLAMQTGDLDMFIVPLSVTSERSKFIRFTAPFYVANSGMVVKQAGTWQKAVGFLSSFFSLAFLQAFSSLFFIILVFGFLVWIFEHRKNPEQFGGRFKGIWSGIWWSAVTMTTVGYGDKAPKTTGGKIVALFWMFAAIMIISGFTASIASSLTVSNMGWNKNHVVDYKELPVATVEGSATAEWLEERFFSNIVYYPDLAASVSALEDGQVEAVAYDEPALKAFLEYMPEHSLELLEQPYNLQLYAFGFADHIPDSLVNRISTVLLEETESFDWQVLLSEYDLEVK